MIPTIRLTKEAGFALIKPKNFLGKDLFQTYRKAVEGSTFDGPRKLYYATLDKVPGILARLRDAGFAADVAKDLVEALSDQEAQEWVDLQGAKERAEKLDDYLHTKKDPITGEPCQLYAHQRTGIPWLALHKGGVLADDMGLGKTIQALGALPANPRVLVVSPAVAKGVWRRQVAQYRSHLRVTVLKGRGSFRWPEPGEVLCANYDILPEVHEKQCLADRKDKTTLPDKHTVSCEKMRRKEVAGLAPEAQEPLVRRALLCSGCLTKAHVAKECHGCLPIVKSCPNDVTLVLDEGHRVKNPKAARTIKCKALSRTIRSKGGRTWVLTGTPLQNKPEELWTLCDVALVAEQAFGSFKDFVRIFDGRPAEFGGWYWGDPDTAEVAERLERVMLRRRKEDVLDLPERRYQIITVEVDEAVLKECDAITKQAGGIERVLEDLDRTLTFQNMSRVRAALATAKIPAMLEIVEEHEETGEPLVVFSAHRAPVDLLATRTGWATITGDTPADKRSAIEDSFQRGELVGVACTIKAGGEAITLTRSAHVLRVDSSWNPAENKQADDRVHRIGQNRGVLVRILAANHPLDERVAEVLARKQHLIDQTVDAAAQQAAVEGDLPESEAVT